MKKSSLGVFLCWKCLEKLTVNIIWLDLPTYYPFHIKKDNCFTRQKAIITSTKTHTTSKGIPPNTPKDPIDDHEKYTVTKITRLWPSSPNATAKKPEPTFSHCRPPQFDIGHLQPLQYPKKICLDISKYRQIQIWDTRYTVIIGRF